MFRHLSVSQRLSLSFIAVIAIGSFLLNLPISHYAHSPATTYLDHLFNTVSMVCVTGLSVVPVSQAYNGFGQLVSMSLMQIGGLGLVTLIAISTFTLRRKLGVSDQDLLQSALSRPSQKDLKAYLFSVYRITFAIEGLAALVLMTDFIPRFGWGHGIFNSIFLAISAFCNAGFDNIGSNSLQDFALNPTVNLVVAFLIISGGLGFSVWMDLLNWAKQLIFDKPRSWRLAKRSISHQSHLVLTTTAIILLLGTLITWLFEYDNVKTIGNFAAWQQVMVSFFQSVTMRTAGFATISYSQADFSTNLAFMLQMILGGAPGGTAGGIKVTTAAIMFLLFKSELAGSSEVVYQHRIITRKTIMQAFTVVLFFMTVLLVGYLLLLETNPELSAFALLFEAISAIATTGVSMDLTTSLNTIGRIIIMLLMFVGRVGPITVLISLVAKKEKNIRYAPTDISVG